MGGGGELTKLQVDTVTVLHVNSLQLSISSKNLQRDNIRRKRKYFKNMKATVYMMYSSKRIEGPFTRKF